MSVRCGSKIVVAGLISSAATAFVIAGAGQADATPAVAPNCFAADSQIEHITATGGCGAKAGAGSVARSTDVSNGGIAVAVSDTGGNANAFNLYPGSSALSGAVTNGTSLAVATGPGATAIARGRNGGVSVSIAGWGGKAYVGEPGARCSGGFAAAYDSITGQGCIGSGSNWLEIPR